jgi:HEAT repeat protein
LGCLRIEPETVVPQLTESLKDPRPAVRRYSAAALMQFEKEAGSAVPSLIQTLADSDRAVRFAATNALLKISPESLTNAASPSAADEK